MGRFKDIKSNVKDEDIIELLCNQNKGKQNEN